MSQLLNINIVPVFLTLCLVITDTVQCYYPCYAPCYPHPFYYTTSAVYADIDTDIEGLSTTTATTERAVMGRRTCNIWCWLRRVGLFVVRQLLADEDGTSQP